MNIFKQYGIREVADVVFYSITRIGDEEFYVPVLFFDTLKVATIDKSVTAVTAAGGTGNGKVLSWSFDKNIKLKLEDALFSQMSLNTFMNGRVMAKMSDWTSAIAKLNVANKYGQKHYSVKAYPSPEISDDEWEIIYRCAQKAGFDPRNGYSDDNNENPLEDEKNHSCKYIYDSEDESGDIDKLVAENRWLLKDHYYRRTQKTPHPRDISQYLDYNARDYESVNLVVKEISKTAELREAQTVHDLAVGECWGSMRHVSMTYREKGSEFDLLRRESAETGLASKDIATTLCFQIERTTTGYKCNWAYLTIDNQTILDGKPIVSTMEVFKNVFTGYNKDIAGLGGNVNPSFHIGNEFFLNHILFYIFPHFLEDAIGDLCWCDLNDKIYPAMPQQVIDYIAQEIDSFSKAGRFENDLYEAQYIDRFEKCTVKDRKGLKIDLVEQMLNVKKLYNNEQSTFTVFYDQKTMLPFMGSKVIDEKVSAQKCVRIFKDGAITKEEYLAAIKSYMRNQYPDEWVDSLTHDDYVINKITNQYGEELITDKLFRTVKDGNNIMTGSGDDYGPEMTKSSGYYLVYFNIIKRDYYYLKYGTTYLKRCRVIDEDVNDITFLGTNLSIDVDTFPGEFLIVGETYVREQQTGKDRRMQFVINRAAISASTKIQLQASGNPTTFSIDVDVLVPKNKKKSMFELIQYDVEEDKVEGGTKVVPQDKHHSYTPTLQIEEQIIGKNIEIY